MTEETKKDIKVHKDFDVSETIKGTDLLKSEDIEFLKYNSDKFEHRFKARSLFRSKFEMEASVLNDDVHPTPDSKYFQAIGEQNVHLTELISLIFNVKKLHADVEIKRTEIDDIQLLIEEIEQNIKVSDGSTLKSEQIRLRRELAKKYKAEVELSELEFNIKQSNKVAQERIREIKTWEPIIEKLHEQLEFGDENFELHHPKRYFLRYFNRARRFDILTPEDKENVVSHFLSFAGHPENKEEAVKSIKTMIEVDRMNPNHGLITSLKERIERPDTNKLLSSSKQPNQEKGLIKLDQEYTTKDEAKNHDPVIKNFFDRKVMRILVCSPHRYPGDKMVTNMWRMQTPASFECNLYEPHGMSVAEARIACIKKARAENYNFVYFIDDDTLVPTFALVQLVHHEADIVGGFYYRKYLPLESVGMHEKDLGDGTKIPCRIDNYKIGDIIHNTLVLPSGCTLINLDIFNKIEEPWYRTITIAGAPAITEDTYFCQKARMAGYDIITDTGIQCVHVDIQSNRIFGHPDIVDTSRNALLRPQDYCLYQ